MLARDNNIALIRHNPIPIHWRKITFSFKINTEIKRDVQGPIKPIMLNKDMGIPSNATLIPITPKKPNKAIMTK